MEHTISERAAMGVPTRNSSGGKSDVPRIKAETSTAGASPRSNPGAAGGADAGMSAKKIPVAGPPKGRGNGEGRP